MKLCLRPAIIAMLLLSFALINHGHALAQRSQPCPGDLDHDYDVDLSDLAQLLSNYGDADAVYEDGDLDEDGDVDLSDLAALLSVYGVVCPSFPTQIELAGNELGEYPFFEFVMAFNENASVSAAVDPTRCPELIDRTVDLYVVAARDRAEWESNRDLTDVRIDGPQTIVVADGLVQDNVFSIIDPYELDADAGLDIGRPYDLVLDVNRDGVLDGGDYLDGAGDRGQAGLYLFSDLVQAGPLDVTETIYTGGDWLAQDTYYPTNVASMGRLPLIVISHGNGHDFTWYDHIGYHMASWGYIVMSHANNTVPGIETASTTTLTNTDYIIGAQDTIIGGVLDGHIDSHRITWIGHSRGGEGVARAYDRLIDGDFVPVNYTGEDILLISSMAPTDFLKTDYSNPHGANYHLWTASADDDVNGGASCDLCQTYHLHDRADGFRHSTTLQGVGHGDLHDGGGSSVADGPCLIGRAATHLIQKGYFLPLIKHYIEGNIPATDFFWRQWETFKPIGAPTGSCIVVTNTYRNGAPSGNLMIDDYQSNFTEDTSSCGAAVTYDVENLTEDRLDDNNSTFSWTDSDPMNGMTAASSESADDSRGVVFDWYEADRFYEFEIPAETRDLTGFTNLSFRACQGTRHPYTIYESGDLTFSVTLRDAEGRFSTINIGAYGGGLEQPYNRSSGWHNEFETIKIRLADFLANGAKLDLSNVEALRFDCGPSFGSSRGRIGLDEVMFTSDAPPNVFISLSMVGEAIQNIPAGAATPLAIQIFESNENYIPDTAMMHYRFDDGEFTVVPMTDLGDGVFQADLPALDCDDLPEFYFSAEGDQNGVVTLPNNAPVGVFTPFVGEFAPFFEEYLDVDPGWTTQGLWAFGDPTGDGGQYGEKDPEDAYTGVNVYGYNLSGDYENSLPERHLTTAAIDCSQFESVYLSFYRWLGVEQPLYDHAYIRVSVDGSTWHTIWQNAVEVADGEWNYQEFDITEYAAGEATVYIRWTMGTTDGSWQYCGWNIDDVVLSSFICE